MAMFDDPKKELQKLEQQLLKEEEWFSKELDSAKAMIGDAPVKKNKPQRPMDQTQVYRKPAQAQPQPRTTTQANAAKLVRNTENLDVDLDAKKPAPKKKGVKGLVILAVLETLGIVGVVAYWLLFLL